MGYKFVECAINTYQLRAQPSSIQSTSSSDTATCSVVCRVWTRTPNCFATPRESRPRRCWTSDQDLPPPEIQRTAGFQLAIYFDAIPEQPIPSSCRLFRRRRWCTVRRQGRMSATPHLRTLPKTPNRVCFQYNSSLSSFLNCSRLLVAADLWHSSCRTHSLPRFCVDNE